MLDRHKKTRTAHLPKSAVFPARGVALFRWLKHPFLQHLLILILATLLACCMGYRLLVPEARAAGMGGNLRASGYATLFSPRACSITPAQPLVC